MLEHRWLVQPECGATGELRSERRAASITVCIVSFDASDVGTLCSWRLAVGATSDGMADREQLLSGGLAQGLNEHRIDVVTIASPSVLGSVAAGRRVEDGDVRLWRVRVIRLGMD